MFRKFARRGSGTVLSVLGLSVVSVVPALALTAPIPLGTAGSFSVLAGSTVTNTGPTVVSADSGVGGNLGVSPGTAVTGFPPGSVTPPGTQHAADAVAGQAQADLTVAYNTAAGLPCDANLTDQDLGGLTLTTGVYCYNSSAQLTGPLALNAQGDPDAVFVFQIGSTLTTASNSSVVLLNGAQACNVYWQVGSSATLGTGTAFSGNILALTSITANTAAQVQGRLLARNGAVTLDNNLIHSPACAPTSGVPQAPVFGSGSQAVAAGLFIAAAGFMLIRRRRLTTQPTI
jgi:type VI secretion system secreted protein VgrG